MTVINIQKVAVSLTVEIPHEALENQSPVSAVVIAEQLADEVMEYERQHHLGYYAALVYYQQQGALDEDLINAVQGVSWLACSMAQEEVKTRLRPVFSSIKFSAVQSPINSLPAIRPNQSDAQHKLIKHFTADVVKLIFIASLIRKSEGDESTEAFASHLINRWLKDRFASFEINSVHKVE